MSLKRKDLQDPSQDYQEESFSRALRGKILIKILKILKILKRRFSQEDSQEEFRCVTET